MSDSLPRTTLKEIDRHYRAYQEALNAGRIGAATESMKEVGKLILVWYETKYRKT